MNEKGVMDKRDEDEMKVIDGSMISAICVSTETQLRWMGETYRTWNVEWTISKREPYCVVTM